MKESEPKHVTLAHTLLYSRDWLYDWPAREAYITKNLEFQN